MATLQKMLGASVIAGAIGFTGVSAASGATLYEDFEGLASGNTVVATTIADGTSVELVSGGNVNVKDYGVESSRSIDIKGGAVFGTGTLASTPDVAQFSMVAGIRINGSGNGVTTATGSGFGFGWSTATDTIAAFGDGSSNMTIVVAKTSSDQFSPDAPTFRLGYANNTSTNTPTLMGETGDDVELALNHWYRLDATVSFLGFNGTSSSFEVQASLYDLGEEGSEDYESTTLLLSGSANFSYAGDWSQSQPIFFAKDDRGFNHVDNLSYVPEPAALSLLGLGGLLALRRRARA